MKLKTLIFYEHLITKAHYILLQELNNKTNSMEDLSSEVLEQNKILLKYSELRIKTFELLKKAILEDMDKYALQLEYVHEKIDEKYLRNKQQSTRLETNLV